MREQLLRLTRAGYNVDLMVLNASHYGVPQERRRVFVQAWRDDTFFRWPIPRYGKRNAISARSAIGHLLTESKEPPNYIKHFLNGKDILISGNNKGQRGTPQADYHTRSFDRPAFTMLAGNKRSGWRDYAYTGKQTYILKERHIGAIQSFPSDFKVPDNFLTARRLLGNAVPPILAQCLGDVLHDRVEGDTA